MTNILTVTSGWETSGGDASGWNGNETGAATNGGNFGEADGDNFNDGYGSNAGRESGIGVGDGACHHCGQGKSPSYIIEA
jgi:hypothetical protein